MKIITTGAAHQLSSFVFGVVQMLGRQLIEEGIFVQRLKFLLGEGANAGRILLFDLVAQDIANGRLLVELPLVILGHLLADSKVAPFLLTEFVICHLHIVASFHTLDAQKSDSFFRGAC